MAPESLLPRAVPSEKGVAHIVVVVQPFAAQGCPHRSRERAIWRWIGLGVALAEVRVLWSRRRRGPEGQRVAAPATLPTTTTTRFDFF